MNVMADEESCQICLTNETLGLKTLIFCLIRDEIEDVPEIFSRFTPRVTALDMLDQVWGC